MEEGLAFSGKVSVPIYKNILDYVVFIYIFLKSEIF